MSDANIASDPFLRRARIRSITPKLEALADEYDRESEPPRCALNAVLAAAQTEWPNALYTAGAHLARLDLSDARWGYSGPPGWNCSRTVVARYCLVRLARAAASGDRDEFDRWRVPLAVEPTVAGEAVASLLPFALDLVARSRRAARDRTAPQFSDLLNGAGLIKSWDTLSALQHAGCLLTPGAEDAVRHWVDRDAVSSCSANGRIAALGCRSSPPGDAPEDTIPPDTRDGEPPAGKGRRPNQKRTPEEPSRRR